MQQTEPESKAPEPEPEAMEVKELEPVPAEPVENQEKMEDVPQEKAEAEPEPAAVSNPVMIDNAETKTAETDVPETKEVEKQGDGVQEQDVEDVSKKVYTIKTIVSKFTLLQHALTQAIEAVLS